MSKVFFKDDNGYHGTLEPEGSVKTKANILDFSPTALDTGGMVVKQSPTLTDKQREQIAKDNEAMTRKPIIPLDKISWDDQKKLEILERCDNLVFVQVSELGRNPDGSIPSIPNRDRKILQSYWIIGRVAVHQHQITDGFGNGTGLMSQRKEILNYNPSVELVKTNAYGQSIGEDGFNRRKDLVYAQFIETKLKDKADAIAAAARIKDEALRLAQADKIDSLRATLKPQLAMLLAELKTAVLAVRNPEDMTKDKTVLRLTDEYNRIETILKSLSK